MYNLPQQEIEEKDSEILGLNRTIQNLMLDKCGLSDRLRKLDVRLDEREKQVVALEQKLNPAGPEESKENPAPDDPFFIPQNSLLNSFPRPQTRTDRIPTEDLTEVFKFHIHRADFKRVRFIGS